MHVEAAAAIREIEGERDEHAADARELNVELGQQRRQLANLVDKIGVR